MGGELGKGRGKKKWSVGEKRTRSHVNLLIRYTGTQPTKRETTISKVITLFKEN